jgi:hypothetical protein
MALCARSLPFQAAEKLNRRGFVSGLGFSRADKANKMSWALQAAEKLP